MKVSIAHDKRRISSTGENAGKYPIKIRLSYTVEKKTFQKLYPTGYFATPAEFKKIKNSDAGRNAELQEIETRVHELYAAGKKIIKDNPYIDAESFGYELTNAGNFKDPLLLMESYAKELRANGRVGNADYYDAARSSFIKFFAEVRITPTYSSITPKLLHRYEKWMTDQGRSITTVGMYCIAMRTVFNLAISKRKISDKLYPFGKGKYVIPTAKGRKLALTEIQKDSILSYHTLNPIIRKAVDLWIFSYFCYGINFADIARLKFGDIKNDNIVFDRTKTITTGRERSFIEIPVRPEVWNIIKKWGNYSLSMNPNAYVFPVLKEGLTPKQIQDRVHDFIADTNDGLALACKPEELNLPKITTYWARHTFATIAYRKGAGIEFIQKALGHQDPKTTQRYIESFDIETKRMVSNWL